MLKPHSCGLIQFQSLLMMHDQLIHYLIFAMPNCFIQLYKSYMKPIILKILYGDKSKVVEIGKSDEGQNANTLSNRISFGRILTEANKFRLEQNINTFLDIFIKQKNDEWINIYEMVGTSQISKFQTQPGSSKHQIAIKLIDHNQKEEDQSILLNKYHEKINAIGQKIQKIEQKVQEDVQKIQEDYTIDLAFFYAEPIVNFNDKLIPQATSKQVSFLLEIKKIFQKLNLLEDQKQDKKRPIRSAKIQIQVGTVQNIKKALSKGVKIMHFSCHGQASVGLQLQTAQKNVGVVQYMNFDTLKKILAYQKKSPQIIIYNACNSKNLAEETFKLEVNGANNRITSIGYEGLIGNWYCEKFSSDLYSKLFNGQNIQQFFQNIRTRQYALQLKKFYAQKFSIKTTIDGDNQIVFNHDVEDKVRLQQGKIKIFYNKEKKLKLTPSLVNETNPLIQVRNKLQKATTNFFKIDKCFLYQSMKKILNQKKAVIGLFGDRSCGKTCLIKKILEYFWQRGLISQYLSIQLRLPGHNIETTLQFECKLQQQLENMNIKINKDRYFLLAIDHCDRILKYQQKQFQYILDSYQKGLQNKGLKAKFVFVSSLKGNRANNSQDIEIGKPLFTSPSKPENSNHQEQMRQWQMAQFMSNCHRHINREIDKLPFKFIAQMPIVSIFPKKMLWSSPSQAVDLLEQCGYKTVYIEKRIQTLLHNLVKGNWNPKQDQQELIGILKLMYLIIGVIFLQFYKYKLLEQKQTNKHFQQYQDMIQRLEVTTFKFLAICFNIDQENQLDEKIRYAFHILWVKLHFIIHYLKSLPNKSSNEIIEVVVKHISRIKLRQVSGMTNEVSPAQILEVAKFNKKLCSQILKNQRSGKFDYQLNDQTNEENQKIIKFDYQLNDQTNQILKIIEKMKNSLKNKFEGISPKKKKFNLLQNLSLNNYITDCNWIQNFQFSFHIYDENAINMTILPFFPLIKAHINMLMTKVNVQSQQILNIISLVENYQFILTKNTSNVGNNDDQRGGNSFFANIFNYYREDYLNVLFQIQKIRFNNFIKVKKVSRIEIINKLNQLIKQCDNLKFQRLKRVIEKYKRFEFNSFAALVSIPLSKPYRYEQQIIELVQKTQLWFGEGMFPRIDTLSQNTMSKYIQNNLFIPVTLFVTDTFVDAKKYSVNRKMGGQSYFCLNTSGGYQQGDETSNIKKFSFFNCEIAIFCGKGVKDNLSKVKENFQNKIAVVIYIDTIGFDQVDNKNKKSKKQGQLKQKLDNKDIANEIYEKILEGMITKQMLTSFYEQFCKVMFLQRFGNYLEQVQKSFLIAKRYSEISCLKKFGASYLEKLNNVFEKITYEVMDRNLLKNSDQLRLNERKIQEVKVKEKYNRPIGIQDSSIVLKKLKKSPKQIGFSKELATILQHIKKAIQANQSAYLILSCQSDEYKGVIENLKIKLKIMGITHSLCYNNDMIKATGMSNTDAYRKLVGSQKEGVQILLIDQFCNQKANQINRLISQIKRSEQRLKQVKSKVIKIQIIAINQSISEQQMLQVRSRDAKVEFIELNKLQVNTFFAIQCQKLISYKLSNPRLAKQSQYKYLSELARHNNDGKVNINQNKLNQLWSRYIDNKKTS